MDNQNINTKPDIHKIFNGDPLPGSFIKRDGKAFPNIPADNAVFENEEQKKPAEILPSKEADCSDC